MKVHCHTNLDLCFGDKHNAWPESLPERPVVGDLIRSSYKHTKEARTYPYQLELVVVRVTWTPKFVKGQYKEEVQEWILDVELHLPPSRWPTLRDFYNFYEKLTGQKFI